MIELADLLEAMAPAGARLVGSSVARRFDGFAYDSRNLRPGELFLAVRTARADGHDFIAEAVRRGATAVVGDRLTPDTVPQGVTAIAVDDTLAALRAWARYTLDRYSPTVIAVVGNVGKTTAAKSIVSILGSGIADDPEVFDGDNHNTLYGLSIALGNLKPSHRIAVLELVGDEPGDLIALAELTHPTIAVVVGGFDRADANAELDEFLNQIPDTGHLALNTDDPVLRRVFDSRAKRSGPSLLQYGIGRSSDVWADSVELGLDRTKFVLREFNGGRAQVVSRLLGRTAVYGALAAAAVGRALGLSLDDVAEGVSRLDPLSGRLRPLAGLGNSLILDDSFDAGPAALAAGLDLLALASGRKTVVLGDLAQSIPSQATKIHRRAALDIARQANRLITLGHHAEAVAREARALVPATLTVISTDSAADARAAAREGLQPGDATLVVGGAGARLERVVEGLLADPTQARQLLVRQEAGWKQRVFLSNERPTWVEVDLAAIGHNVEKLREIARPAVLMAVLKADGYGHGAVRVARTAVLHGASYLATACLSEAIALRQAGISAPILILGYTPPWQVRDIVAHDLTATVFDLEPVRHLARAALALGRGRARVQIKVDTGMGRLGLLPADVATFVESIRSMPGIEAEGIFTHFACADSADPSSTLTQIARFDDVLAEVRRQGWEPKYVHASNSAGTLRFPEARYTMVRAGIALYGLDPSEAVRCPPDFRPTLTFKTQVAQVKDLPSGSPISYGATFVTDRPSRIAVLPVGYGDGFRRTPRTWGDVLIRGQRAPIVGAVCMDMCMIDVTDVSGARTGDEVVLIGRQGNDDITVAEVARKLGTISYEVITQILARVPREVPPGV
jgi:alanine racemase